MFAGSNYKKPTSPRLRPWDSLDTRDLGDLFTAPLQERCECLDTLNRGVLFLEAFTRTVSQLLALINNSSKL